MQRRAIRLARTTSLLLALSMAIVSAGSAARPAQTTQPTQPASTQPAALPSLAPPLPSPSDRTDYLNESFEGAFPPAGWTIIHAGGGSTWTQSDDYRYIHSGLHSARIHYDLPGVPQDEYLVTPALDLSAVDSATLEFYEFQAGWPAYGEQHSVAVSTTSQTDPAAFTPLVVWTPTDHSISDAPVTLSLADYVGESTVYLAFRYTGENADDWYLDDVRVTEPFDLDVALRDFTPDAQQWADGDPITPSLVLANVGKQVADVTVVVTIEESGQLIYSHSQAFHILVGETVPETYPTLLASAGNYYRLRAEAQCAGDEAPDDNVSVNIADSYTRPHVPLGWFQTNAGCGPCAAPEAAFDAWLPGQADAAALIRLHAGTPDAFDPLYLQNASQNHALVLATGPPYFTPHFWVDGVEDYSDDAEFYLDAMEARQALRSPGTIDLHWRAADSTLVTSLALDEPLDPAGDYRLQVAVTEDSVFYAGGNGHPWHSQALRRLLPLDLAGIPVDPSPGRRTIPVPLPLVNDWDLARLNATVYLQEQASRRIWQARSGRLDALRGRLSLDPSVVTTNVGQQASLSIRIAPSQVPVKGVELRVDYDETLAQLDSIAAGSWVTDAGLGYYFFDYPDEGGAAHVAMAFLDGARQTGGELARLHFSGVAEGAAPLIFTLEKVRDASNTELGYATSTNDSLVVLGDLTPIAGQDAAPPALRVLGSHPNPFNPSTTLSYALPAAGRWRVAIYDTQGRRVRSLADGPAPAGLHELRWDGRDDAGQAVGGGVYLVRVSGPMGSASGKLVLLK